MSAERRAKVWLLYVKHQRGDNGRLSLNILREVCSFLHFRNLLVDVTQFYIRTLDFQTGLWKQLPHPHIQVNSYSIWVLLESGSVFVCGGDELNTAYIIGDVCVERGRMHEARCNHGVLAYSNSVYVFGGWNSRTALNSCEKYHLQQQIWTLLPPMQKARAYFNPCLFNGDIYLCGSSLLEAFYPEKGQILPFQLSMPVSSACCMYVEDNLLVVHLDYHILKYRAEQDKQLVQNSSSSTQKRVMWQNSLPVVLAALRVYYITQSGRCYCVNMDTGVRGPAIA